jgi:hypothetical protein
MRKTLLIVLALFTLMPLVSAQSFYATRRDRNLIVSGGTGAARYFGDLVQPGDLGKVRPNLYFGAEYFFTARISVRAEATWFQIAGADAIEIERNLSFKANNFELGGSATLQLFPNEKKFYQRKVVNPYIFAGYAFLWSNPTAEYQGKTYALQPLQTEGEKYSRIQPVIPYGFGIKIKSSPWMDIAVEACYRETFTDYLDDVSKRRYVDRSTLPGGVNGISAKLSDRRNEIGTEPPSPTTQGVRGNPNYEDSYATVNVKLLFYVPSSFGSGKKLYTAKRKASKKTGGMYKVKKRAMKPHAPKKRR